MRYWARVQIVIKSERQEVGLRGFGVQLTKKPYQNDNGVILKTIKHSFEGVLGYVTEPREITWNFSPRETLYQDVI